MAIASRSSPCSEISHVCALLSSSNAGRIWWRLPTITWFWPKRWSNPSFVLGKASTGLRPRTRCIARWTNCCRSWGRLLVTHNHAGNRWGGQKGPKSARLSAFRSSQRRQNCQNWSRSSLLARSQGFAIFSQNPWRSSGGGRFV